MSNKEIVKTTVVIPAYNEEIGIKAMLNKMEGIINNKSYEVIFVDDGSTDETNNIVKEYPVKLITHKSNRGYGAALKTGIRNAIGDKIITLDSDLQHDPKDIKHFFKLLNENDMVIGERSDESFEKKTRSIGKKIIRIFGEYLMEQKLPDYNSGFRGFDKKIIIGLLHIMPNGFSFSTTSTLAFIKEGYSIGTVRIIASEREGRRSNVKYFKDGIKTLLLVVRIIMLFNPLKVFLPITIKLFLIGVAYSSYNYYLFARIPNTGVICLLAGIIIFLFGLLADQISVMRRRPS